MPKATIAIADDSFSRTHHRGRINHLGQKLLLGQLEGLSEGELILIDGSTHRFGQLTERCPLSVRLEVTHPAFYGDTAFGGTLGAAQSYVAGDWNTDDLPGLIRLMVRNRNVIDGLDGGMARLAAPLRRWLHWMNRNSHEGSRRNIAAHYDLGNDFFGLFLDESMMYSCALFEPQGISLAEASIAKLDRICQLLDLKPSDRVIEIGTGWGGFAIHAARNYGCHVTTTTISENQHALARTRIAEAGLEDRITLLKEDYRHLQGRFDKLVSIEMIEAVGHHFFETFYQKCSDLLADDGLMLIQAITINDREYLRARDEVDFIKRYIFPGSCIPAITPLMDAATRATDLQLVYLRDIGRHYAQTLRIWRERFLSRREDVLVQGYSESFIRLWEFYLAYCEGGYAEGALGDLHLLYRKPLYSGPLP
jgi:cyclopropane-fatty-acyl-phospholipid synthase